MGQLKSKQISNFNSNVVWTSATSTEIPNSKDVMNEFIPEDSLVIESFTNLTIGASKQDWPLTLTFNVQDADTNKVSLFINGLKIKEAAKSVSGAAVIFNSIDYDIDIHDTLEVHYIKDHTV